MDFKFSSCGNYILSLDSRELSQKMTFINVSGAIHGLFQDRTIKPKAEPAVSTSMEVIPDTENQGVPMTTNNSRPRPDVRAQHPNAVTFGCDEDSGQASMSILRQFQEEGTLILTTLSGDGRVVRTETISRLPRDLDISEAVLVSKPSATSEEGSCSDNDTVRLVINVKKREWYPLSLADKRQSMPMVLERKRQSIPVFETRMRKAVNFTSDRAFRALEEGAKALEKQEECYEGALDG